MLERIAAGKTLALLGLTATATYFAREPAHICRYSWPYEAFVACTDEYSQGAQDRAELVRDPRALSAAMHSTARVSILKLLCLLHANDASTASPVMTSEPACTAR